MNIDEKCREVTASKGWSQRQLANELRITEPNLISARKGRRPLPAHALARLERLRGVDDSSIVEEIIRTAACVALAVVTLFVTAPLNHADASTAYSMAPSSNTNYGGLWSRITATAKRLLRAARRRYANDTQRPGYAGWPTPA